MLDELIHSIEAARSQGAVIFLKCDGERQSKRCTVLINRADTGYSFRQDTDDIWDSVRKAWADYDAMHST